MELPFSRAEKECTPFSLPLPSLRLLVPPLRLMAAYLWQLTQRGDAVQYGMLADFVSQVMEAVPDLLSPKHAAELILGLRARVVLELCRGDCAVAPDNLQLHLESIQLLLPVLRPEDAGLGVSGSDFVALVETLLRDPDERMHFFQHVFPDVCGSQYHEVLQTLMWDFLERLEKLLPAPDLLQTVSWLDGSALLAADCAEFISQPEHLKCLVQHPQALPCLDPYNAPSVLGGAILSLLLTGPLRQTSGEQQREDTCPTPHAQPAQSDNPVSSEEIVMEIVTMTEGTEMEQKGSLVLGDLEEPGGEEVFGGGGVSGEEEEETEQGGVVDVTLSSGEKKEQSIEGVSDVQKRSKNQSEKAVHSHVKHEAEENCASITSCVGREDGNGRTSPNSVVLVGWRRSQRKPKKTWKVKVMDQQMQKREVTTQEKKHQCTSESSQSSVVSPICVSDGEKDSDRASQVRLCTPCPFSHQQEVVVRQHQGLAHADGPGSEQTETPPPMGPALPHACADCGKSYRFASELKAHQHTHSGERLFKCAQCPKSFVHSQGLTRHRHTHAGKRSYECGECSESFPSLAARAEHRRTQHQATRQHCEECGKRFSSVFALARHRLLHAEERPHKCPQCSATFTCLSNLSRHALTHRTERAYRCNCGKAFAYRGALLSHQKVHSSERPYRCGECGKGFLYKGGLEQHRKTHSDETPFLCPHCGKGFKRQRSLSKHVRGHTREDVFRCSQCEKTFCYKASLTRHELTHSGERPFLCDDCGKSFFSFSELQKHQRFHTGHKPFQCPQCGKTFTQSCYLTLHMRYHTGARPYACPSCAKSFSCSTRLKRHLRIHTGERPYRCSHCSRCFQQSHQLKTHLQTHLIHLSLDM